jgi:acylphosphatase
MVGFRYYSCNQASRLHLNGWVKNNPDGTVEILAEGEKKDLEELIQWCHKGPSSAVVTRVDKSWLDYQGDLNDFSVKY